MTARMPASVFDAFARCLTVSGTAEVIHLQVESPDGRVARFELDAESAVNVAHDLLERAFPQQDCDEVAAAVAALRALALREDALRVQGQTINGDGR